MVGGVLFFLLCAVKETAVSVCGPDVSCSLWDTQPSDAMPPPGFRKTPWPLVKKESELRRSVVPKRACSPGQIFISDSHRRVNSRLYFKHVTIIEEQQDPVSVIVLQPLLFNVIDGWGALGEGTHVDSHLSTNNPVFQHFVCVSV